MLGLINYLMGIPITFELDSGVYSIYLKALIAFHSEDLNESRLLCEKCIKHMKNLERVRIQPFLLYAKVLSTIFEFNLSENIYIEILTLFPYCADGYTEYGKFLYQFDKRYSLNFEIIENWNQ
jgi:hypothetical protein